MPIPNRNLEPGVRMVARYKKERYVCSVNKDEAGKLVYVLEDGRRSRSPSSAASSLMGGKPVNGWCFSGLEGVVPEQPTVATEAKGRKSQKLIYRVPNQLGIEEGKVRFWCNACMQSFIAVQGKTSEECPVGQRAEAPG